MYYKYLIEKQKAGTKLTHEEIHALMLYALELLREFGAMTQASIDRIKKQTGD